MNIQSGQLSDLRKHFPNASANTKVIVEFGNDTGKKFNGVFLVKVEGKLVRIEDGVCEIK